MSHLCALVDDCYSGRRNVNYGLEIKMKWYKLNDNKEVIECEMHELSDRDDRVVKQEDVDPFWISTVFLMLDHSYPEYEGNNKNYKPLVFETMIKNTVTGEWEDFQERYRTYAEALKGHETVVERLKQGLPINEE